MAASARSNVGPSPLDEVCAQLDQKGPMDWRYLASHFSLTAEEIRSLGEQPSPAKALMDALRARGVDLREIAETCHKSGLRSASNAIETYSRRVGAHVKGNGSDVDLKGVPSQQWPGKQRALGVRCMAEDRARGWGWGWGVGGRCLSQLAPLVTAAATAG